MQWFLGLGIAGLVVLAAALVFDGFLEGLADGIGGLFGAFDGLLSLPVIAGFVSMLGFSGAIVLGTTGLGAVPATAVGTVAGVGAGWLTARFSRALMQEHTPPAPRGDDLIGSTGSVVTAIPVEGYGEVMLRLAGQPAKFAARSSVPIARGTEVWVESAPTATSVVVRPVHLDQG
ncbi:hypothetical protein ACWD6I_04885 [Streptomyces sp. NPDC002454]|jgi:membrane protein implicated in regulation of membrane protease activity|uniref:hypothetical protein n=1 Tax=unclassified Streptomyces TaxID=2593676 RepID=UPI003330C97D